MLVADRITVRFEVPFDVVEKSAAQSPGGKLVYIAGRATSQRFDAHDQVTDQETLDWSTAKSRGLVTVEHPLGVFNTVGFITDVQKAETEDGLPAHDIEVALYYDDPLAKAIYDKALLMKRAGGQRKLGFSIDGKVLKTDIVKDEKGDVLKNVRVDGVVITAVPACPDAQWEPVAASLFASTQKTGVAYPLQGVAYDSQPGAEASPLVGQSLKRGGHGTAVLSPREAMIALVLKQFPAMNWPEAETSVDAILASLLKAKKGASQ